jgi:hypothetical protein
VSATIISTDAPVRTCRTATFALVFGIFGFLIPLAALAAIGFGHWAHSMIERSGGRETGRGLAIAGFILGYVSVMLYVTAFFLFT